MGSVERGLNADKREMERGRGEDKTVGDGDLVGSVSEEGSRGNGGKRGGNEYWDGGVGRRRGGSRGGRLGRKKMLAWSRRCDLRVKIRLRWVGEQESGHRK